MNRAGPLAPIPRVDVPVANRRLESLSRHGGGRGPAARSRRLARHFALAVGWALVGCAGASSGEVAAFLDWDRRLELSTPVSGVLTGVTVQPGQRVAKGEVLVELDQRPFRAALARAEAAREEARMNREEQSREQQRTSDLYDRTLLSEHERQLAAIALAGAEAALRKADAELVNARLELEYSRVRAPFDALVVTVPARAGEVVVSRFDVRPLVVVAPAGRLRARALVDMEQAGGLRLGQSAQVEASGRVFPGTLVSLGLEPDDPAAEAPFYPVDVLFDIPDDARLRPGHPATVRFGE